MPNKPLPLPGQIPTDAAPGVHQRINHLFADHAPYGDQASRYEQIRAAAKDFAHTVADLTHNGNRDSERALQHIREAVFYANASIALQPVHPLVAAGYEFEIAGFWNHTFNRDFEPPTTEQVMVFRVTRPDALAPTVFYASPINNSGRVAGFYGADLAPMSATSYEGFMATEVRKHCDAIASLYDGDAIEPLPGFMSLDEACACAPD